MDVMKVGLGVALVLLCANLVIVGLIFLNVESSCLRVANPIINKDIVSQVSKVDVNQRPAFVATQLDINKRFIDTNLVKQRVLDVNRKKVDVNRMVVRK